MRYVARDSAGNILAVYTEPQPGAEEPVAVDSPELLSFVLGQDAEMALRSYMASTDSDLLRIIEDLINVLIDRNVILLSDFPPGAQKKLLRRAPSATSCNRSRPDRQLFPPEQSQGLGRNQSLSRILPYAFPAFPQTGAPQRIWGSSPAVRLTGR